MSNTGHIKPRKKVQNHAATFQGLLMTTAVIVSARMTSQTFPWKGVASARRQASA